MERQLERSLDATQTFVPSSGPRPGSFAVFWTTARPLDRFALLKHEAQSAARLSAFGRATLWAVSSKMQYKARTLIATWTWLAGLLKLNALWAVRSRRHGIEPHALDTTAEAAGYFARVKLYN